MRFIFWCINIPCPLIEQVLKGWMNAKLVKQPPFSLFHYIIFCYAEYVFLWCSTCAGKNQVRQRYIIPGVPGLPSLLIPLYPTVGGGCSGLIYNHTVMYLDMSPYLRSLAKQGDYALGSVHPYVCLSFHLFALSRVNHFNVNWLYFYGQGRVRGWIYGWGRSAFNI